MTEDIFKPLRWGAADFGYTCVTATLESGKKARVLVMIPKRVTGGSISFTGPDYNYFETHPTLFRVFAETPPTEKGIIQFANKYGQLGLTVKAHQASEVIYDCERVEEWVNQINAMRESVELWETLRSDNAADDQKAIGWQRLSQTLNHYLADNTALSTQYLLSDSRPRCYIAARNLAGALWLQLARGIDGNMHYIRCRTCARWMEISLQSTGFRTNRDYCSDACRSRAYRERQAEAHRLQKDGMEIKVIAKRLRTDVKTVKGWLEKPPPGLGGGRRGRPPKTKKA